MSRGEKMEKYVAVIGAVNVDIGGRSFAPLMARDSNPGSVTMSLGGVGRNIAHNLRKLSVPVEMLTVLGSDRWADIIEDSCRELGIGLGMALRAHGERTSSYLYITGPEGDMELAVCDTDIARFITPEVIEHNLRALNSASCVVFDGNLTAEAIEFIAENVTSPLFADPVSVAKSEKLRPVLGKIHTLKPNLLEAQALTGGATAIECAEHFRDIGVRNAFISDGGRGMTALSDGEIFALRAYKCRLVNATGGGDAAMAGLIRSFLDGQSAEESAKYALAAGSIAVESEETINPAISDEMIKRRILEAENE